MAKKEAVKESTKKVETKKATKSVEKAKINPKGEKTNKKTGAAVIDGFLTRNRLPILIASGLIVLILVVYIISVSVINNVKEKDLGQIEQIEYLLTKDSTDLTDEEYNARLDKTIENLQEFVNKGGIIGTRANMLCADVYAKKGDNENAKKSWETASKKSGNNYLRPLCKFQAAVYAEELGNNDEAIQLYVEVAKDSMFLDKPHALFSVARLNETKGNFTEAQNYYQQILDAGNTNDVWASLAKTRLIALQIDGKIE